MNWAADYAGFVVVVKHQWTFKSTRCVNDSFGLQDFKLIEEKLNHFMMPAIIEGRTDILISQIAEYAKSHTTVFLDCSLLERVEFGASAQLLSGLVPIAAKKETQIQFHEVNHLVMCLFNAMGLKNVAAIFPRKR